MWHELKGCSCSYSLLCGVCVPLPSGGNLQAVLSVRGSVGGLCFFLQPRVRVRLFPPSSVSSKSSSGCSCLYSLVGDMQVPLPSGGNPQAVLGVRGFLGGLCFCCFPRVRIRLFPPSSVNSKSSFLSSLGVATRWEGRHTLQVFSPVNPFLKIFRGGDRMLCAVGQACGAVWAKQASASVSDMNSLQMNTRQVA